MAAPEIGSAVHVVGGVYGNSLLNPIETGDPVHQSDTIITAQGAAVVIDFADGSQISLGPSTRLSLQSFTVPTSKNEPVVGSLQLIKGFLRFIGGKREKRIELKTAQTVVSIRGTVVDLLGASGGSTVYVEEGQVSVGTRASNRNLGADGFLTAETSGAEDQGAGMPSSIAGAREDLAALLGALPQRSGAPARLIVTTTKGIFAIALEDPDGSLAKALAPLIADGYYADLAFDRVLENLVQTTPPGPDISANIDVPTSAYEQAFETGSVALIPFKDGTGISGRFFVTMKPLDHLNGRFPVIGLVVEGLDSLKQLDPGDPPRKPDRILSIELDR